MKIHIIPQISLVDNKVTRLKQGNFALEKVYDQSPLDFARRFEDHGIKKIQIADLEGSRKGNPVHYNVLETIAGNTGLEIDFTGGLHTEDDVGKAFEYGAKSITASSVSVDNKNEFANWISNHGRERIALAADSIGGKDGTRKIYIKGWQKDTGIDLFDHVEYFYSRSLKFVKTTDISRDGNLEGPSFTLYRDLLNKFPGLGIIASGGVRNLNDIEQLQNIGVYGVIFGRAYYEGGLQLKDLEQFLASV